MNPPSSPAHAPKPLSIFIADDSSVIRERLTELLGEIDGVVVIGQAADVPSAQQGIAATRPDIAILDIRMPGGSGIDVLRQAKQGKPGGPSFIMYTNYGGAQYRQACAEAGADFFFDKSTDGQKLAAAIRMLAARS